MKLTFLGTRGYIDPKSPRHRMHTSTMIGFRRRRLVIDCGENWRHKIERWNPHAIVITHPHPDHAFGLKAGARCPVYATKEAWMKMKRFAIPLEQRRTLTIRRSREIAGMTVRPFSVVHSVQAPAVGFRITAGKTTIFYVPDVISIRRRSEALSGIRLYIGDGAAIARPIIRKEKTRRQLVGHSSIRTQLGWCKREHVPKMIVTHCGSEIVKSGERKSMARLRQLASQYGVEVEIAYDGMELILR